MVKNGLLWHKKHIHSGWKALGNCYILSGFYPLYFSMPQKQKNRTRYNVIWAFSLFAITLLGVALYNRSLNSADNNVSTMHGAANLQINNIPVISKKADLTITTTGSSQWWCNPYNTGQRSVTFYNLIKNVWMTASSQRFSPIYVDWTYFVWGAGTPLSAWWSHSSNRWLWLQWWAKYTVKFDVMPVNSGFQRSITWPNQLNYVDWSLDRNPNNNSVTQTIYVNPCP